MLQPLNDHAVARSLFICPVAAEEAAVGAARTAAVQSAARGQRLWCQGL